MKQLTLLILLSFLIIDGRCQQNNCILYLNEKGYVCFNNDTVAFRLQDGEYFYGTFTMLDSIVILGENLLTRGNCSIVTKPCDPDSLEITFNFFQQPWYLGYAGEHPDTNIYTEKADNTLHRLVAIYDNDNHAKASMQHGVLSFDRHELESLGDTLTLLLWVEGTHICSEIVVPNKTGCRYDITQKHYGMIPYLTRKRYFLENNYLFFFKKETGQVVFNDGDPKNSHFEYVFTPAGKGCSCMGELKKSYPRITEDPWSKKLDYLCLQGVLKDYFDCNLEYPNTVDELLFFYGNYSTDNGNDKSFIRFIQQEKEKLQFRSNWINAWKEELAVVFDGDTIINMTDERDYFDLFLLASNYYYYNDDYPVSMDDLVIYDSLSKSDYRNNHNKAMISFLSKHKQEIKLISSDYDMLIMMEKDTILYYPGGDVKARCYSSSPQYKLVYRFFDHQNHYAYTEELEKYFRYGIRVLALDFAPYEGDYSDVHLMVYTKENGLQPYCEDDDVRLDSDWFVVLEKYLKGFVCQYNLGRVVFGVLELHR